MPTPATANTDGALGRLTVTSLRFPFPAALGPGQGSLAVPHHHQPLRLSFNDAGKNAAAIGTSSWDGRGTLSPGSRTSAASSIDGSGDVLTRCSMLGRVCAWDVGCRVDEWEEALGRAGDEEQRADLLVLLLVSTQEKKTRLLLLRSFIVVIVCNSPR